MKAAFVDKCSGCYDKATVEGMKMVWIELQGKWLPEAADQAMRIVRDILKDILRLETDPAHYRVEIAGAAVRRISVQVDLFPAGSARSRRKCHGEISDSRGVRGRLSRGIVALRLCACNT